MCGLGFELVLARGSWAPQGGIDSNSEGQDWSLVPWRALQFPGAVLKTWRAMGLPQLQGWWLMRQADPTPVSGSPARQGLRDDKG